MLSNNTKLKILAWSLERAHTKPNLYRDGFEAALILLKGLYDAFKGPVKALVRAALGIPLRVYLLGAFLAILALAEEGPRCQAVYGRRMVVVEGFFRGCFGHAKDLSESGQVYFDTLKCTNGVPTYNRWVDCKFLKPVRQSEQP